MNAMLKELRADTRGTVDRILSTESLEGQPVDLPRFLQARSLQELLGTPVEAAKAAPETQVEATSTVQPSSDAVEAAADASVHAELPTPVGDVAVQGDQPEAPAAPEPVAAAPAVEPKLRPHHEEMMARLRESLAMVDDSFVAQRNVAEQPEQVEKTISEETLRAEPLRNEPARPRSPFPPATYRIRPAASKPATIFGIDPKATTVSAETTPPPPVLRRPAKPIMPPEAPAAQPKAAPVASTRPTLASLFLSKIPAGGGRPSTETLQSFLDARAQRADKAAEDVDTPITDPSAIIVAPVGERTFIPRPVNPLADNREGESVTPGSYLGEMFERIREQEEQEAAEIRSTSETSASGDETSEAIPEPGPASCMDGYDVEDEASLAAVPAPAPAEIPEEDTGYDIFSQRELEEALIGDHPELPAAAHRVAPVTATVRRRPYAAASLIVIAAGSLPAVALLPGYEIAVAAGTSAATLAVAIGMLVSGRTSTGDRNDVE